MALNYVTLTVDLYDGQGNIPLAGSASFTPSAVLTDTTDLEIIGQQPVVANFRLAGLPPVSLLATDSPGPLPGGWTWGVTFAGITGAPAAFSFFLPANPVTYTATNANPCVFTVGSGSAPPNGTGIQLLTGAPAGFTNGTTYFVVGASGTTFRLAAAIGGTAIASSSTGAGNMITATQRLSNLTPVAAGTSFAAYLPLAGGTMTGAFAPAVVTLAFGATISINAALGNVFAVTLTSSAGTFAAPASPVDGQEITVRVIQDGTGSRTVAWNAAFDFGAGGAPTLSTGANKVDILRFQYVASLAKWAYVSAAVPQGF